MKKIVALALSLCAFAPELLAQKTDSLSGLLRLSIENLMNIPIYSASKTAESTFEAPLSSSVITKNEIKRSGCTSIMEALRLVPGLIVREQTNGNYDIHLRGQDNAPPNAGFVYFTSTTTLVMIDNYPVYNYLHGGTFWETLPIDINDVERIEVIRGPSAALFGPNAVSGVINIITRKPQKQGLYSVANAHAGSYNSILANASAGYNFNEKISAVISANFQNRNRTQTSYYDETVNQYVDLASVTAVKRNPDGAAGIDAMYPHPRLAQRKFGLNGFINYNPAKHIQLSAWFGGQHSEAQKIFATDTYSAYLTTAESDTRHAALKCNIKDWTIQVSYLNGTQSPITGGTIWKWDFNTQDALVEYKISGIKNLTITPGIMYRRALYNDSKYVNTDIKEGLWSGKAESITKAASLRTEYKVLNQRLRLVAGGRADRFNHPEKTYISYQLAATYKINEQNLIRVVHSTAYRTPLLIDLYSNLDITGPFSPSQTFLFEIRGNKDIKLLSSSLFEAGYRLQPIDNLTCDIELFTTKTRNFSYAIFENGAYYLTSPVAFRGLLSIQNITLYTKQWGASLTVNYIAGNFQFKPFVTMQKTMLYDYSQYVNSSKAPPLPSNNNNPAIYNMYYGKGSKIKHKATPDFYGGAYINWQATPKLNLNISPWFYSKQTQLHSSNLNYNDGIRGIENIKGKIILNAAISYAVIKQLTLSVYCKNLFTNKSREFYRSDTPALIIFGGASWEF